MATAQELATRALTLAQQFLDAHRGELAALAGGDTEALAAAAQAVRASRGDEHESARGAEHVAFTLLSIAFRESAQQP